MKIFEKIYWIFAALSVVTIVGVYYWEIRYLLESYNPLRNELIVGAAITILYTSPVWIGFPIASFIGAKVLSKTKRALSFLPAVLVFMPILSRGNI